MPVERKEIVILSLIFLGFLLLHLPGLHLPYHQDEYKWPIIVNPELTEPGGIPHPPVGEFIYRDLGKIVGYDNFRAIPFVFGLANLLLLFYLIKNIFHSSGESESLKKAFFGTCLFAISFYSLLSSLMVDTDGAIMPFFFLIMAVSYYKLRDSSFRVKGSGFGWLTLLILGAVGGFLVKASFIVGIGALALDFAFEIRAFSDKKKFLRYVVASIGAALILAVLLLLSKFIFPAFRLEWTLSYWQNFFKIGDRAFMQTFIQFAKSLLYISPLLAVPLILIDRQVIQKTRPFIFFIGLGLLFYLIIFDFSGGALDRYMQFLVVPLCIISGAIYSKILSQTQSIKKRNIAIFILLAFAIFVIQFFDHFVPPLYPKAEWIQRALSLKWNFLFPFNGGSGPTGFYISFAFMAVIWILCIILAIVVRKKPNISKQAAVAMIILGILYNVVFIEEHLFGKINGSPYGLFDNSREFIKNDDNIKKVVVYNDIGGYEIRKLGKYQRRLYAAPQFESTYKDFFKDFNGHVLYIDIPRIGEGNLYSDYFASCKNIYEEKDRYITSKILDCRK